ncbi:MAG: 2-isopropylmalate synthase [Eubacteriaceae bacterium]|nr:2-isopropylmalate synthase [Eubacteriaceae bacterium]
MGKIFVFDTTLRDGEQTPGVNLGMNEKIEIARQLESLGVDIIEVGFPTSSKADFEACQAASKAVGKTVAALCRATLPEIQATYDAIKESKSPRIHIVLATSDLHLEHKLRMSRKDALKTAIESVAFAKTLSRDVEFSCEDASRTDPEFLQEVICQVIAAGASTVSVPDTVGFCLPDEYAAMVSGVIAHVPNIGNAILAAHCHNDLGLAVSNTIAALRAGATQFEACINGIGERAGNCALEEVVMALEIKRELGIAHNVDISKFSRVSARVASLTGVPVPLCKAIVGQNAFSHQSGIHQHGILANPLTYQIISPQSIGRQESAIVLGKLSGKHAFASKLERLGYAFEQPQIDALFADFKNVASKKREISDDDLEALITNRLIAGNEFYSLESFQIQSGNKMMSMASICLVHEGNPFTEAALGDGPIDASYNAISRIVGGEWHLASYDIKAVTEGVDALGEVVVRVRHNGQDYTGKGLSTDIIEASIHAYLNAINRVMATTSPV